MRSLNELLDKTEDRRRFFMRDSVIPSEPDTRPRDESKRDAVLAVEIAIIKEKVDMSHFSKPPKELIEGWRSLFKKDCMKS
jgi:hypothetical protein